MSPDDIRAGHSYVFEFGGETVLRVVIHWPRLGAWSVIDEGSGAEVMLWDGHLPLVVREASQEDLEAARARRCGRELAVRN